MIDRNVLQAKLVEIDKRVRRIAVVRKAKVSDYEADELATEATALNLMLAVQAAIDLGAHLIADQDWAPAMSSADVFVRLCEQGVIPRDLLPRLKNAVGFRNVVAHGYAQLDMSLLHLAAHAGVDDLVAYSQQVAAWATRQA